MTRPNHRDHNGTDEVKFALVLLLYVIEVCTQFHGQLELIKRAKERESTMTIFLWHILLEILTRNDALYVSKTTSENSFVLLECAVQTFSFLYSQDALASYGFNSSHLLLSTNLLFANVKEL